MKKLLATTALVGLVTSSAAIAEVKVSGSIEQTYNSVSIGGTGTGGKSDLGQEVNLKLSSSKDLDNGLKVSGHANLEDKGSATEFDSTSIKFSGDALSFHVGVDTGQHIHSNINPRVDDNPFDSVGLSGTDGMIRKQAHDKQHVGLDFASDFGKIAVNYSPNGSDNSNNSSATGNGDDGSITEINFKGSLGVEGLTVLLGQETIEAKDSGATADGSSEEEETVIGVSYNMGQFAVGASQRSFDDGNNSTVNNDIDTVTAVSATFALNDNVSVGVEQLTGEFELGGSSGKTDEETTSITLGYNLGGLAVSAMYVEADNVGGSTSTANDKEAFQIRTVYKF